MVDALKLVSKLGEGSFAIVYRARPTAGASSSAAVAVKELRQRGLTFEELVALPEVAALRAAGRHNNLVQLQAVSRVAVAPARGGARCFLVQDLCDQGSLLQALQERAAGGGGGGFSEAEVRGAMRDLLSALAHLHDRGGGAPPLAHRDVKPENILIGPTDAASAGTARRSSARVSVCKLCDFGQAAPLGARRPLTAYVGTRWYRAPELLLRAPVYSSAIDVWAAGCVMAELFLLRPLFPGTSDTDQLFRIASVLGSQGLSGVAAAAAGAGGGIAQLRLPAMRAVGLSSLLPTASAEAVAVVSALLTPDPARRPRAADVLRDFAFFRPGLPEASLRTGLGTGLGGGAGGLGRSAAEESVARACAEECQLSIERDLAQVAAEAGAEAPAGTAAGAELEGATGGGRPGRGVGGGGPSTVGSMSPMSAAPGRVRGGASLGSYGGEDADADGEIAAASYAQQALGAARAQSFAGLVGMGAGIGAGAARRRVTSLNPFGEDALAGPPVSAAPAQPLHLPVPAMQPQAQPLPLLQPQPQPPLPVQRAFAPSFAPDVMHGAPAERPVVGLGILSAGRRSKNNSFASCLVGGGDSDGAGGGGGGASGASASEAGYVPSF